MTTKTDIQSVMALKKQFTLAQRGIISQAEEETIREVLELGQRNFIELQNVRDTVVLLYIRWAGSPQLTNNISAIKKAVDTMCAICYVVDHEISKRRMG